MLLLLSVGACSALLGAESGRRIWRLKHITLCTKEREQGRDSELHENVSAMTSRACVVGHSMRFCKVAADFSRWFRDADTGSKARGALWIIG